MIVYFSEFLRFKKFKKRGLKIFYLRKLLKYFVRETLKLDAKDRQMKKSEDYYFFLKKKKKNAIFIEITIFFGGYFILFVFWQQKKFLQMVF